MGYPGDLLQMNVGQLLQTPPVPKDDFTGQTVIITGSNTGLGFEAAKHFYSLGVSHLILACRNMTKAEDARAQISKSNTQSTRGKVEVWQLDMSSYNSVFAFGERLKGLTRLDAFIVNAAIDVDRWEILEGNESTITVNVISTFLMAMLAIPKLRESAKAQQHPSHLVITGTVGHIFANGKLLSEPQPGQIFKTLNNEATADMNDRYHLSKLIVLFCVRQLAKQMSQRSKDGYCPVILNYVNPGWCKTELFRTHDGGMGGRIGLRLIGRTAELGSRTLVHAAIADESSHGKYLSECRVKPESSFVRSDVGTSVEKRVWGELLDILEGIRPGVTNV